MEGFNSHLNMEQMNKALISLNDMYNKLAAAGRPGQNGAQSMLVTCCSLLWGLDTGRPFLQFPDM